MSGDPLGFFAGEASSSSESESENEEGGGSREEEATRPQEGPGDPNKLPSPDTLFATVGKPAFLNNPLDRHIDWDQFVKNPDPTPEPNIHATGSYAAIPPPRAEDLPGGTSTKSMGVLGGATEISAPPVRYSPPSEVDPKHAVVSSKLSSEDTVKVGIKRPQQGENVDVTKEGGSSKKLKTENFRLKEKRKRDMGQSSRGKNYVEEEKRILRQQYRTDELLS